MYGIVVGRWTCIPEVPGSGPPPCHWMDLSSVAPNSTPPRHVNSQLLSLPPVGILTLLCLICIVFVCNAHLIIFTWNLRDINVNYYHYYYYHCPESFAELEKAVGILASGSGSQNTSHSPKLPLLFL